MGKNILIIVGSASKESSNLAIAKVCAELLKGYHVEIIDNLSNFPHFNPELTENNTPDTILKIREKIQYAAGIIFSSPEYIFSIPSGLKNLLEWCVATTIFSDKPVAIITASASGEKGHEELQLIMQTLGAVYNQKSLALIQGIKGKISQGLFDDETTTIISNVIKNFQLELEKN